MLLSSRYLIAPCILLLTARCLKEVGEARGRFLFLRFPSAAIDIERVVLTYTIPATATNKAPSSRLVIFYPVEYRLQLLAKRTRFLTRAHHHSNTPIPCHNSSRTLLILRAKASRNEVALFDMFGFPPTYALTPHLETRRFHFSPH